MTHKSLSSNEDNDNKAKQKRDIFSLVTCSQVGEVMDKSKFEDHKCLKKNRVKFRRSDF